MGLDLEPDLESGLRLPEGDHFGAGIAGDHGGTLQLGKHVFFRYPLNGE
jgi:hypothetical protein